MNDKTARDLANEQASRAQELNLRAELRTQPMNNTATNIEQLSDNQNTDLFLQLEQLSALLVLTYVLVYLLGHAVDRRQGFR